MKSRISICLLAALSTVAFATSAMAQLDSNSGNLAAPDYGSGAEAGTLSNGNFNTPESDGRPGVYFFQLGSQAIRKHDYRHAVDMFQVAASWAYKPAEYDLGLMYFKGEGVPVDRSLGAAWMILAAERNQPVYVKARNVMVTVLNNAEFARTDQLWSELKGTYGDEVALRRAKAQWAWARSEKTGSRVGGVAGNLHVGAFDKPNYKGGNPSGNAQGLEQGWGYFKSGSVDGAIAYREFQQSNNPYDPIFQKNLTGSAHVGPLSPVKDSGRVSKKQQDEKTHNL